MDFRRYEVASRKNDENYLRKLNYIIMELHYLWKITLFYTQTENGKTDISVRFAEEDVWVTQVQLAEVYQITRQNIGQHIENIYRDEELPRDATIKKFFIVQQEGSRQVKREIEHYNLDVIIAIGYRIQSTVATRFRRWKNKTKINQSRRVIYGKQNKII